MKNLYLIIAALLCFSTLNAQTDLIISEYVEAKGSNKALEIANPTNTTINLSNYRIARFSNGANSASTDYTVNLPDFDLEPYKAYVITQDKRESAGTVPSDSYPIGLLLEARADLFVPSDYGTGAGTKCVHWNGNDAITLEKNTGGDWNTVDMFGKKGEEPAEAYIYGLDEKTGAWTDTPPYFTGQGNGITADHTMVRKSNVTTGVTSVPAMFNPLGEYDTLSIYDFSHLGWHEFDNSPTNAIPTLSVDDYYSVASTVSNGYVIFTIDGADTDQGQNLEYYIVGNGNYIYSDDDQNPNTQDSRHEPFYVNRNTGELYVVDAASLDSAQNDIVFYVAACDEYAQSELVSVTVKVSTSSGITSADLNELKIYPNPTNNSFVTVEAKSNISLIEVFSADGRVINRQDANNNKVRVDLNGSTGIIFLKTTLSDKSTFTRKVIVK